MLPLFIPYTCSIIPSIHMWMCGCMSVLVYILDPAQFQLAYQQLDTFTQGSTFSRQHQPSAPPYSGVSLSSHDDPSVSIKPGPLCDAWPRRTIISLRRHICPRHSLIHHRGDVQGDSSPNYANANNSITQSLPPLRERNEMNGWGRLSVAWAWRPPKPLTAVCGTACRQAAI